MDNNLNRKVLDYIKINKATDDIVKYIDDRRKGVTTSLKTRWSKFNSVCMGGIEPNILVTIGGISGSGKSSFVNSLETDLFDLNPDEDIVVLSFSYEMISAKQIGRKLSYKLKKTVSELYSGNTTSITDEDFIQVKKISEKLKQYNIYYCDTPGSIEEMENTILHFNDTIAKNKWLIIILDHTLLIKGKPDEEERIMLSQLQRMFIRLKKRDKNTIIQLTQLNRNIEQLDRIKNPSMHFPQRSDISGSDSVYAASDYVIILHRPEILGIQTYGVYNWPAKDFVYMHISKNRDGEPCILQFINNLKYNSLDEPET